MTLLGRVGYGAKAVVFAMLALLNLGALVGWSGPADDVSAALERTASLPLGRVLLAVTALGLMLHGSWLLFDGLVDPCGRGTGASALVRRIGVSVFGIVYLTLTLAAMAVVVDDANVASSNLRGLTGWLIGDREGAAGVLLFALLLVGVGIYRIQKGMRGSFMKHYHPMQANRAAAARWFGGVGLTTRGVWFALLGIALLVPAGRALEHGSVHAVVSESLGTAAGPVVLTALAIGTLAYAGYCVCNVLYRDFTRLSAKRPSAA